MIGQRLLQYQIVEKLGEGAMGVVYKARDTHLNRFVAIKMLPQRQSADPERRRRFAQEARAASALNHPNIVTIHEINEANGADFICMEFIAGKTLDHLIPRHGFPLSQALQYAVQIADAFARSHAAGIIHRDLKPSNVMVDEHGLVKVLDFGVAKLMDTVSQGDDEPTRSLRTQEGKVVGTPAYMSPEQVEGKAVDPRSDIFSFGSLLYEMLAGQAPFRRDSQASTMAAILREEPKPLSEAVPGIPREVERIVKTCLRKDPSRRLQHMDDAKAMLLDVKEDSDSGLLDRVLPVKRRYRGRWAAVAAVVAAIALAAVVFYGRRAPEPAYRADPLTALPGWEQDPSFSPDGNRVAYSWNGERGDNVDIYVKMIGLGQPSRITTDPAEDVSPAWAPNGNKIAFLRKKKDRLELMTVLMIGGGPGQEKRLAQLSLKAQYREYPNRELAWSPDSKNLVFFDEPEGEEPGLFVLSEKEKEKRRLTTFPKTQLRESDPAFSPDGRTLAFVRISNYSFSDLYLLPLTADARRADAPRRIGEQFQRERERHSITQPTWTPDGHSIVFVADGSELWKMSASGTRAEKLTISEADQLDISRKEPYRLVYHEPTRISNLAQLDLSQKGGGSPPVSFVPSMRVDTSPQYSPDGKRVLFASNRLENHFDIWVCNSDGTGLSRVTDLGAGETGSPRWFPDSKRAVFDSDKEGTSQIYAIDVDEGSNPKQLTFDKVGNTMPAVSEDGKSIYFSSRKNGAVEIWRMPADGGGPSVQVTTRGGYAPVEVGGFLYYLKGERGDADEIWRMGLQDGVETKVLDSVAGRRFAIRKGSGLYFFEAFDTSAASLQYLDFVTGKRQRVATLKGRFLSYDFGLTVSPDGRFAVYSFTEHPNSSLLKVGNFR